MAKLCVLCFMVLDFNADYKQNSCLSTPRFTKTFNPSLLQKENAMHSERRNQASKLLSSVAKKLQNPRLATLAVRVRLDAFTRVKKAIDDMVSGICPW